MRSAASRSTVGWTGCQGFDDCDVRYGRRVRGLLCWSQSIFFNRKQSMESMPEIKKSSGAWDTKSKSIVLSPLKKGMKCNGLVVPAWGGEARKRWDTKTTWPCTQAMFPGFGKRNRNRGFSPLKAVEIMPQYQHLAVHSSKLPGEMEIESFHPGTSGDALKCVARGLCTLW